MTSFNILGSEYNTDPEENTEISFRRDYDQTISETVFNNMFDSVIVNRAQSDTFLVGLFNFINTDSDLKTALQSKVPGTHFNLSSSEIETIKTALYDTAVSYAWASGDYLQFIFFTSGSDSFKFCIRILMQNSTP
jgi:hypothetical protein